MKKRPRLPASKRKTARRPQRRARKPPGRTERLLAVIALFLRTRRPLQLADVERVAECSPRTAYRLLAALVRARLITGKGRAGFQLRVRPAK